MTTRVCLVQPSVPLYRAPVFEMLGSTAGIELTVCAARSLPGGPAAADPYSFHNFKFVEAPIRALGPFLSQSSQFKVVRHGQYDVVILPWGTRYIELLPALLLARATGVKTILWGNGVSDRMFDLDKGRVRRRSREALAYVANGCLLYGDAVATRLRNTQLDAAKVFVARNAIDQTPIQAARKWWTDRPERLRRFQADNGLVGKDLVIFISRLHAHKRVDLLLDALAQLRERYPLCHVAIIGDGDQRAALESYTDQLGLRGRVTFVGALYGEHEVAPWCLSAVACVIPGLVGLSILHAFGYGLPVITPRFPEYPEIEALEDGVNGYFHRVGDASSVADRIRHILEDPAQRMEMANAALATVVSGSYTLSGMVAGFVSAINGVLASQTTGETPDSQSAIGDGGLGSP